MAFNIKTFVINLDRRQDRWEKMEKKIKEIKEFKSIERFSAIDGKQLKWNDILKKQFPLKVSTRREIYESHHRKLGVIGCALSHYNLWKKCLKDKDNDTWLILEDDIVFSDNFNEKWKELYGRIENKKWDILYLGHYDTHVLYNDFEIFDGIVKLGGDIKRIYGAGLYSYCVRRSGLELLVKEFEKRGMRRPVDWFITDLFSELTVYRTNPLLVSAPVYHPVNNPDTDVQV